jgi:hypothetical protein
MGGPLLEHFPRLSIARGVHHAYTHLAPVKQNRTLPNLSFAFLKAQDFVFFCTFFSASRQIAVTSHPKARISCSSGLSPPTVSITNIFAFWENHEGGPEISSLDFFAFLPPEGLEEIVRHDSQEI